MTWPRGEASGRMLPFLLAASTMMWQGPVGTGHRLHLASIAGSCGPIMTSGPRFMHQPSSSPLALPPLEAALPIHGVGNPGCLPPTTLGCGGFCEQLPLGPAMLLLVLGVPKPTSRFGDSLRGLTALNTSSRSQLRCIRVKGYTAESATWKGTRGKVWRKPGTSVPKSLPYRVTQDALISVNCDSTCKLLSFWQAH